MPSSARIGKDLETGQPLTIGDIERRSGLYILGIPGMGKSALLVNIMLQDREHGHGFFFLDPHGDAITDLAERFDLSRSVLDSLSDSLLLLDPKNDTHSFGINPLACRDISRMSEREDTYKRAYNIFSTLWEGEEHFGPWLQLILQNTLRAFIDNPEFTLADVPLFLNPYNSAFRNYIVSNITHYSSVADFWRYEFSQRREREQQERMDAVLTRVNTLLGDPYVHDIVGQKTTTINFAELMEKRAIILVNLPANLATDSRRFIGALLISELVHAVRNRPEDKRHQFCIFVDEFQNFASADDDFSTLITEARKFGVATTIAHQERYGQFADNKKLLGATAAAANKVFFQLTVKDAQELAPEFASLVEGTEKRREAELVISPRPIEDIWERGHPEDELMYIRNRYLWIVELPRSKPQEKYFLFDRSRITSEDMKNNPGNFQFEDFADWEWYRSSADMLRQALLLLNQYYYDYMGGKYDPGKRITDAQLQIMLTVIECLGGVFGFLPLFRPYIPEPMRHALYEALKTYYWLTVKTNYNPITIERGSGFSKQFIAVPDSINFFRPRESFHPERIINSPGFPRILYDRPQGVDESTYHKRKVLAEVALGTYQRIDNCTIDYIPSTITDVSLLQGIRQLATYIGMSTHELENLIEWELQPLTREEKSVLAEMVTLLTMDHSSEYHEKNHTRIHQQYALVMSKRCSQEPVDSARATERLIWQMGELTYFVSMCLRSAPEWLAHWPVKIPSGKYDETLKVERTQQDLINEKAVELSRLPRFTAYAKGIEERDNEQVVLSQKIETYPLSSLSERRYADEYSQPVRTIIEQNTIRSGYCTQN